MLADEVVRGDMMAAVKKMYPAWKKKEALKFKGEKQMEAAILKSLKKHEAAGVKVMAMVAGKPSIAWEVNHGIKKLNKGTAKEVNVGSGRSGWCWCRRRKS